MSRRLVVVGDALLDRDLLGRVERLAPDAPVPVVDDLEERSRPGGAGLAAVLAAADGREVTRRTALCDDAAGRELAALLRDAGVTVLDLGLAGATAEKVRVRADGRSLLRLDRGDRRAGCVGPLGPDAARVLAQAPAVLVADYGRGVAAAGDVRAALAALPRRVPVVWDPHPRGSAPVAGMRLVTPNGGEARHFCPDVDGDGLRATTTRARQLAARWEATAVAVTMGSAGALVVGGDGPPLVAPAPVVALADPCGAGDRFASAAAGLLADGALPSEAVTGAVAAASAFVTAGGAAAVDVRPAVELRPTFRVRSSIDDQPATEPHASAGATAPPAVVSASLAVSSVAGAAAVVATVRAAGGTVVATGGCFDLLHAGHVAVLQQARRLGDCLVVCLNSDDSVRRLKGADRPLVDAADRAAVLLALGCVDAVAIFEEDTPAELLATLRPDVFAKGGDYAVADLPEASVVAGWGGQAVVLPYLDGRSTTNMIKEAVRRGVRL